MVRQLGCAVLRQALREAHYNLEARLFISGQSSRALLKFWCDVAELSIDKVLKKAKSRGYL